MTVTTPPPETAIADAVEVEPPPPARAGFQAERIRPILIRVVVLAVVVALGVVFFETLVTQKYFQVRQSHLFTQFAEPQRHLGPGEPAAILQVPKLGLNLVIVQGDGSTQLHSGPGHRPGTPLPGRRGNSIVLGHASAWGGPFGGLSQLKRGAFIVTQLHGARRAIVFKVTAVEHVSASNTKYSAPSKDFELTLITGDGGLLSSRRLVIEAVSGRSVASSRHTGPVISVPHPSPLLNPVVGIALGSFLVAGLAYLYLRRRYRLAAVIAVLLPLLTAGLFAVLLDLDLLLPPLR